MRMPGVPGFSFFEASVTLRTPSFSVRRGARLLVSEKPMKLASFEAIARALDDAGVRYLVAGGLAVNAHGYLRFTKDVDIVVQNEVGSRPAAGSSGRREPAYHRERR